MSDSGISWTDGSLFPGETVVWTGRPVSVRRTFSDVGMALYLAIIIPVAIGAEWNGYLRSAPLGFAIMCVAVAILTIAQAIATLVWVLALKPRAVARRRYAVTGRRLLISSGKPGVPVDSWYLDQLAAPQITRRSGDTADVKLGRTGLRARQSGPYWSVGGSAPSPTLLGITGVAALAEHLAAVPASGEVDPSIDTRPDLPVPDDMWAPRSGERVLWTGRPSTLPWWFGSADRRQTAAGLFFPLFVLGMGAVAMSTGAPVFFLVVVAAMFLIGCHVSFGRVFWRRARIARSTYIVTDQRVVAIWKLREASVTEAEHGALLPPQVFADGSVFFRRAAQSRGRGRNGWPSSLSPAATNEPPNFIGLADPESVVEIVAAFRLAAGASAPY